MNTTTKTPNWKPGDVATYTAKKFPATVLRVYIAPTTTSAGMYDVRVPGGETCVSGFDLAVVEN